MKLVRVITIFVSWNKMAMSCLWNFVRNNLVRSVS